MERCSECGSWGVECANEKPVPDCGCARCLRVKLRRINEKLIAARQSRERADEVCERRKEDLASKWNAAEVRVAALEKELAEARAGLEGKA